ncbi:MAG: MFS transporter [Dehalococcoidia bacterium]
MTSAPRREDGADPEHAVETDIPARLDRLPWSSWHWLVVIGLGITWILDGLGVTIVGSIGAVLEQADTLDLTAGQVGFTGTAYLIGAVIGALVFGQLTDMYGRRRLFTVTLGLYVVASVLTALAWDFWSFSLFRLITGLAIGGEYAAINSAIDELIPARIRGRVDLAVNGSYWAGAAAGAIASIVLLNPNLIEQSLGWRLCFAIGVVLSVAIYFVRRTLPESPRWLITHGRVDEAERVMAHIEREVIRADRLTSLAPAGRTMRIHPRRSIGFGTIVRTVFGQYRRRAFLGLSLMASQAFFYNAIFFTQALVLTKFFDVPPERVGWYILPFAAGNFLGPLLLGPLFDAVGRRPMIAGTYALSAVLIVITGLLFVGGDLTAASITLLWSITFFVASPAASAAYLTVSEVFPLEIRALAIAFFYAIGTGIGGVVAPWVFGALIESQEAINVFYGYLVGAGLMLAAAVVVLIAGVPAERKSLEDVATPLTAIPAGRGGLVTSADWP